VKEAARDVAGCRVVATVTDHYANVLGLLQDRSAPIPDPALSVVAKTGIGSPTGC
jgi:hypothetical protein